MGTSTPRLSDAGELRNQDLSTPGGWVERAGFDPGMLGPGPRTINGEVGMIRDSHQPKVVLPNEESFRTPKR